MGWICEMLELLLFLLEFVYVNVRGDWMVDDWWLLAVNKIM